MKSTFLFIKNIFVFFLVASLVTSCANIIPPSGGARDSLPPNLIAAFPKDSSLNFAAKKITLSFDEYVEAKDIQQNLLVNPLPINQPIVDYKLNNVFITLKDTLEPNTTYTINFGSAIKDVNEGNIAKNKTYTFSTGKTIDNSTISGKVILAKDGKIDSTLIVVLHPNLSDSAVIKLKPKYIAKLDGQGKFSFANLPKTTFNVFVLPNDYSKKYDDSTKLFGFLNKSVLADVGPENFTIYAYKEVELAKQNAVLKIEENNNSKEDKRLKFVTSLINNRYDILDTALQITFNRNIVIKNVDSIQLLDSSFKNVNGYTIQLDSNKTSIILKNNFEMDTKYSLVINKNAITDTNGLALLKSDTVRFSSFKQEDYGSIKLRINTTVANAVLQIFKDDKLQTSIPLTSKEIKQKLFRAGEYELRILIDENTNGIWDAGNYKLKRQPEKVIAIKNKLMVRAICNIATNAWQ